VNPKPLITIITVVRNGAATLEQTMLSVLNQTYPHIEYIIVDGASTDGTVDIIKNFELRIKNGEFPDVSFRWISEPDKGIYDAMNKGIGMATGEWINFMNSGDRFYDEEVIENVFGADIEGDIMCGNSIFELNNRVRLKKRANLDNGIKIGALCHQAIFIKSGIQKDNLFDLRYKIASDFNLFYHLYEAGCKFSCLPFTIVYYNGQGISSKVRRLLLKEELLIMNRQSSLFYLFMYCCKQLLNYIKVFIPDKISEKLLTSKYEIV
jgi:glycosyltransferase involved in cell wall biosynthesis